MASYHTSFSYKEKNSFDEGYIIVAFEPDSGFKDTYLTMENISDEYYDRSKRFDYGAKYSSQSEVHITIIKKDGTDMSVKDFRSCAKWLTGARTNSWLDMYVGDTIIYSFLGKFLNLEQYKIDARTVGVRLTFSSLSPWAYSQPQTFNCDIGQALFINADGILVKYASDVTVISEEENVTPFGINNDGILYMNYMDEGSYFDITTYYDDGVTIGIDTSYKTTVNNLSDDLYTYINLDIDFENKTCNHLSIYNETLDEETTVDNMVTNEKVSISANQFIISDSGKHQVFGDDFNFVWPRLQPGENNLIISGGGTGTAYFTYRYPMKIGDCAMDIDVNGNSIICDNCPDNNGNSSGTEVFTGTIDWKNVTNTPTTIGGYGITNAYTITEVDEIINNIEIGDNIVVGDVTIDEQELNNMLDEVLG